MAETSITSKINKMDISDGSDSDNESSKHEKIYDNDVYSAEGIEGLVKTEDSVEEEVDAESTEESSGSESESKSTEEKSKSSLKSNKSKHTDSIGDTTESESVTAPKSTSITNPTKNKRKRQDNWIKEVKHYQSTINFLIARKPFQRLVREIGQEIYQSFTTIRWTEESFEALQTASEDYLIEILAKSQMQSIHRNSETIEPKDMQIVLQMMKK